MSQVNSNRTASTDVAPVSSLITLHRFYALCRVFAVDLEHVIAGLVQFNTLIPEPFFGCSVKSGGHKLACSQIPSFFIGYLRDFEHIFQHQKFGQ